MENQANYAAMVLRINPENPHIKALPARPLVSIPVHHLDYAYTQVNQQEMEDFVDAFPMMNGQNGSNNNSNHNGMIPSNPRADARRILDASLLQFNLAYEIEDIKREGNWLDGKQSAKTLMKSAQMRVVLIAMNLGNEMKMHKAEGPASIQVIEGNIQFLSGQSCISLKAGQVITFHENVQHNLLASKPSIFLLTLLNIPGANKDMGKNMPGKGIEENGQETYKESENMNFPDF